MRLSRSILILISCAAMLGATSPNDRIITDPRSVTSPVNPGAGPISINDLYYARSVFAPSWSPDGREIVFTTNLTGRFNLWKVSAAGGWPLQLAQSDDRQGGAQWSPDGKWIVYDQDFGGGAFFDLFSIPNLGGEPMNLTRTPEISEQGVHWSPDGKQLAFSYRPKAASTEDLALLDWQTRKVTNLTNEKANDRDWGFDDWSRDGRFIYADRGNVGGTDSNVYQIEVASGKQDNLTPHQGQILYGASSLSPDGRTLLITSNEKGGYQNVALLDIATRKLTWVTQTEWDATSGDFSPDGKAFTYTMNEDGRTDTYLVERGTGHAAKLPFPEGITTVAGSPHSFSPDGTRLLISHQGSQRPSDLWVYELANHKATQLTFSAIASLNPAAIPPSQLVHYKSFDGKTISAFLWMPFNLKRDGSSPGVVLPHGGPTGQILDSFNRTAAALASRGYVCIAPNVRGSTGYGMAFQKANYKDLGGGDLQDEVYAAKFLAATGYVDPRKIGITGGSYGGFMAMMAIGKTPDVWAAAVELYGITDWLTEQEHETPLLQQYDQSILGDPVKDRKVYEDASPKKYLANAKAPLLVLQGDNDITDPKEEAEQVVSILKSAGVVVDAHYYPNEGHGFFKRENQIDTLQRTVDWFDRYLKHAK
jgi:dipeptidyl aminopeptidase/acylaminoacyl peptidase